MRYSALASVALPDWVSASLSGPNWTLGFGNNTSGGFGRWLTARRGVFGCLVGFVFGRNGMRRGEFFEGQVISFSYRNDTPLVNKWPHLNILQ